MSRILTEEEAEQIVRRMTVPLGFNMMTLHHDKHADNGATFSLCNSETRTKTVGSLWWKKKVTTTHLEPVFTGWCWEECIDKLDKWLKTRVGPRMELADKFRLDLADHLMDEELKKP
jgi:hypothetical protein